MDESGTRQCSRVPQIDPSVFSPVKTTSSKYVIVTPVRDEEAHIGDLIKSVVAQTVRPVEWVIVNDGSTDETGSILDQCAKAYPWVRVVHRGNRGFRQAGRGVI